MSLCRALRRCCRPCPVEQLLLQLRNFMSELLLAILKLLHLQEVHPCYSKQTLANEKQTWQQAPDAGCCVDTTSTHCDVLLFPNTGMDCPSDRGGCDPDEGQQNFLHKGSATGSMIECRSRYQNSVPGQIAVGADFDLYRTGRSPVAASGS